MNIALFQNIKASELVHVTTVAADQYKQPYAWGNAVYGTQQHCTACNDSFAW